MGLTYKNVYWLWLSALVIFIDQVTKQLVVKNFVRYESKALLPHLNLTYMENTGAAFSMMAGAPALLFVVLGVGVSLGILLWLRRNPRGQGMVAVAFCLPAGGALGHSTARSTPSRGCVVAFIVFFGGPRHFPAFNV